MSTSLSKDKSSSSTHPLPSQTTAKPGGSTAVQAAAQSTPHTTNHNTQLTLAGVRQQDTSVVLPKWLATKIDTFRATVTHDISDGVFLGFDKLPMTLSWSRSGTGHVIVTKDALEAAEQAQVQYAAQTENDTSEAPAPPDPAVLCVLGRITADGTFVAPDGRYGQGAPRKFAKEFAKTQLNITLERITEYPKLAAEFDKAVAHLRDGLFLNDSDVTKASRSKVGLIIKSSSPLVPEKLKFRHIVFAERTADNEDIIEGLPQECTIEHWPVDPPAAEALLKIKKSHVALPLQVYAEDGSLVLPSQYGRMLRGAVCFVRFTVTHYTMSEDGDKTKMKDIFVGDVSSISIIHLDPLPSSTPKRRIAMEDPHRSPKKAKVDARY